MTTSLGDRDSSKAGILPFAAGASGIAVLLLSYYKLTWDNLTRFNLAIDLWADPFPDFTRYYYPMGEAIFRIGTPIEGFVYSPFAGILLAAFSPLGLHAATILWVALLGMLICMVLSSIVLSNILLFNYIGNYTTYGTFGFVFWADVLLLLASYVLLVPEILRRSRERWAPAHRLGAGRLIERSGIVFLSEHRAGA